MPDTERGKVAFITGAARGIGRALAVELGRRGAKLALLDKNEAGLRATEEALRGSGVECVCFHADVRQAERVSHAVAETVRTFGRIDYAFNNAGIGILAPARDHSLEDWHDVIETNLLG